MDDWVGGVLLIGPKQMVGTRNALGIVACNSAASISGVEQVKVAVVAQHVRGLHHSAFPSVRIIHEQFDLFAHQVESVGG